MQPTNESELSAAIAGLTEPVRICGGDTRGLGHSTATASLSTARLSGIQLYEPGALTLVAQAGTPVSDITDLLSGEGQQLAFEPPDLRGLLGTTGTPTLGGTVATNSSGPRRIQAGACRDVLLGVRFVDGQGQVIRNGGRVMKNVTGYDLVRLMAGSYGTLGVLTEVSLKVLPAPETTGSLVLHDLDPETAVAAMSSALGSPFEITGAAMTGTTTALRVEGFADAVRYRLTRLRDRLARFGDGQIVEHADSVTLWRAIRDVHVFHDTPGEIWRLSVRPSDAPQVLAALPGTEAALDWGGGLIWLHLPPDVPHTAASIRAALPAGHATRIRGPHGADSLHPRPPAVAALEAALRQRFDPLGHLNPGLMES